MSVPAWAAPKIQFDQMVYDFGKTSQVQNVTGSFKFKNVGDGILKIEVPKPSCGCTIASLKPDTLKAGETGELAFSLNLGQTKALFEKQIAVASNDPETPVVTLTIKADYTPLYNVTPTTVAPQLSAGSKPTNFVVTVARGDGKALKIQRLEASQPWIKAKVVPGGKTNAASAQVSIEVKADGTPRQFNEYVHVYAAGQSNGPVAVIYVYGQVLGDLTLSPEALYWSITRAGVTSADGVENSVARRVTVRSTNGKSFVLKNPRSTIKGLDVELVTKESGKLYEIVVKLNEVPSQTVSGNVTFETSVAAHYKVEVPVVINIFKQ